MDWPAYSYTLLQEAVKLYWPAVTYNLLVYYTWLWNYKSNIPLDFNIKVKGVRLIGDSRGAAGLILSVIIGVFGAAITGSYLPFYAAVGAETGTITESFIKRRLGFKRGQHLIFLDEWDSILGATIFLMLATTVRTDVFIFTLVATFIGHNLFNKLIRPKMGE
ncbi:MAG: CDP-archaeol synthase [Candidatus Altiarchaeales archaeon]|nr:CDP-archaeol synthase [Candidatus Altiarchaeales archaeon]